MNDKLLTEDDIFVCENGSAVDLKNHINRLRAALKQDRLDLINAKVIADHWYNECQSAREELASNQNRWRSAISEKPVTGELCYVLRECPDGWDYQIATYNKFMNNEVLWFSEILATPLKYVAFWRSVDPTPVKVEQE